MATIRRIRIVGPNLRIWALAELLGGRMLEQADRQPKG